MRLALPLTMSTLGGYRGVTQTWIYGKIAIATETINNWIALDIQKLRGEEFRHKTHLFKKQHLSTIVKTAKGKLLHIRILGCSM